MSELAKRPGRLILNVMKATKPLTSEFHVIARWDEEARVFYSESDIPGLVVEAETFDEFVDLVQHFVPELLAENGLKKQDNGFR
jgi:hypothetical protein